MMDPMLLSQSIGERPHIGSNQRGYHHGAMAPCELKQLDQRVRLRDVRVGLEVHNMPTKLPEHGSNYLFSRISSAVREDKDRRGQLDFGLGHHNSWVKIGNACEELGQFTCFSTVDNKLLLFYPRNGGDCLFRAGVD